MTNEQRIAEIRERLEKATPGPWVVIRPFLDLGLTTVKGVMPAANLNPEEPYRIRTEHTHGVSSYSKEIAIPPGGTCDEYSGSARNMELIAHAPEDIAFLLNRIEELERTREVEK